MIRAQEYRRKVAILQEHWSPYWQPANEWMVMVMLIEDSKLKSGGFGLPEVAPGSKNKPVC